jgi:hypothetical protein
MKWIGLAAFILYGAYCVIVFAYGLIWASRHRDQLRKGSFAARVFPQR